MSYRQDILAMLASIAAVLFAITLAVVVLA